MGARKAPHGPFLAPTTRPASPSGVGWCQHRAPHWLLWLCTRAGSRPVCQRGGGRAPMPVSVSPPTAARGQICPRDPPSFLHPLVLLIRAMTTVNGGRDVTDGMWGERKPPWPFQRLQ